ncbi:MAG TPA: hypothetical protein ENI13_00600 [candidate division CPR3 bacterium]|uniref:Uncharacterized protein n=1 Tax=candidate division CPR3 bacterium TaxID=2268181 RepID=A0A7C1SX58_UNCC3|nr:hypothetical protein [candidate division CPR3 bacterium]
MTTKKQKTDWRVICVGMVCLTAAEIYALSLGYNGKLLTAFVGIMALAIGLKIQTPNILK